MIVLTKLSKANYPLLCDMMQEWTATEESIIPFSIRRNDYKDYQYYIDNLELVDATEGLVPDSTYFAYDDERNIFVGAVNIRHYLNERLLLGGGHVGYGVRPSERQKGYATQMLRLALKKCEELGIKKVLVVCLKSNIASAKTIINNGGVLENEIILDDGKIDQRYWITLSE